MKPIFVYGTLRHLPLLEIVGGDAVATPAVLQGHGVFHAGENDWPCISKADGAAEGLLLEGASARARIDYYEGGYGYALVPVTVETDDGPVEAEVYWPGASVPAPGAAWVLDDWVARWGALTRHVAREAMEYFGEIDAETLARRMHVIRGRANARLTAERAAAQTTSLGPIPNVRAEHVRETRPYSNFYSLKEGDLRIPCFDGSMTEPVNRASLVAFDAVVVLPYDPVRDRVLLIEQFRVGPSFRGDPQCFLIEAPAGAVDGGETPEEACHRELREEAGVTARALHLCSGSYPTPAASTEFLTIYVAICDLPDDASGMGGLETEYEDIRSTVVDYARFKEMLDADVFKVGPLVIAGHWLARHRARLRG
ncbi:MAG: NUDIX domain-containing protein [Rhodobacteraceae bacterium]|nr:NUDIX domain-containing protein [Paracoccaceae bacterium]